MGADAPVYSEIRTHDISSGEDTRATARITADPARRRATEGFAQDGAASWYVRAAGADVFEIHRVEGLGREPAPSPRLE